MDFSSWLLFVAVGSAAILSPGPAILLAVSNSIRFGMFKVFLSSTGNVSGLFILSIIAIFGLGAVFKTSTTLFFLIKIVGAGYLIYLGIRQWRSANSFFKEVEGHSKSKKGKSNKTFFLEGFLIAITNPKAILFFTALFPQFINTTQDLTPQFLVMTLTFMSMSFATLMCYGLLATKAKVWFSKGRRTIWFNRTLGSVFVVIGLGVLQLRFEK